MGLKDWLANKVAGVSGYGEAVGRESVNSGLALGRTLYLGHVIGPKDAHAFIFENTAQMNAEGFKPYCQDHAHRPPAEDSSELSKQTRALGIAFAVSCPMAAASNFFARKENRDTFNRSLGVGNKSALDRLNLEALMAEVLRYINLPAKAKARTVLNLEKPGTDDMLGVFLEDLSKFIPNISVGFQRSGILGFDAIAVPLAEETLVKMHAASKKFGW
jgi:hypothetical protein